MFLLRILAVLTVAAIGAGVIAYLFSGDRRYLALSWRITRYAILAALAVLVLFVLERVAGTVI